MSLEDCGKEPSEPRQLKPKDPRSSTNIFSRLLLTWVDPLFWLGCHRSLEQKDLYANPRETDSEKLLNRFNRYWQKEIDRKTLGNKPRLLMAIFKCFWLKLLLQGALLLTDITLMVLQSVLLGYLADSFAHSKRCDVPVGNFSGDDENNSANSTAFFFGSGISVIAFIIAFVAAHTYLVASKNGMISRIVMTGAIYQKVLSLSQVTVGQLSIGHIVNLASNDVQRLDLAFLYIHTLWIAPFHMVVVTYLIYLEIGWYTLILTGTVCLQVPLQILLAKLFSYLRLKSAKVTDSRVRIMNEVITGIRVIKMYSWEYAFRKTVSHLRQKESTLILHAGLIRGVALAFMLIFVNLVLYVTFTIYTANGGQLTAKKVFTTISLLLLLRLTSVHFLVNSILGVVEARVAAIRLQGLLEMEEFNDHIQKSTESGPPIVCARNMSVSWTTNSSVPALSSINFTVNQEKRLLAVVGPVGAGKSTLLQSLLSELHLSEGTLDISGRISYASQDPWVFSASLRDNITFGKEFDRTLYERVLKACALDKDVGSLVNGDLTLVGERGVTLSGGQKARVNLARAVYREADIYLLDDPLSAVDTSVGKHIFNTCIQGLLKDKLVVLATHQVHFAVLADKLLVLKDGVVEAYNSYSSLVASGYNTTRLLGLISSATEEKVDNESSGLRNRRQEKNSHVCSAKPRIVVESEPSELSQDQKISRSPFLLRKQKEENLFLEPLHVDISSIKSFPSLYSLQCLEESSADEYIADPPEEKEQGTLSTRVYVKFFQAGGTVTTILVFIAIFLGEIGILASEWWLSSWALCDSLDLESSALDNFSSVCSLENSSTLCSLDANDRLYIYSGITAAAVFASFARALGFIYVCVNASRVLHNRMFGTVLRSPVLFFDTNSIGRILNRFSKDVGFLDDLLPYIFCEFILFFCRCMAIFLTAAVANPWVIFPTLSALFVMVFIRWYYLKTSRELKRLEALARSPVYSHLSTTLLGLSVIRACKQQKMVLRLFHQFHNQHSQAWYLHLVASRWLSMRLDILSALFVTSFIMISISLISHVSDLSIVALGITHAISLSGLFQYMVRQSTEVENIMVSAERVIGYSKLEPEASLETVLPSHKSSSSWPDKGIIDVCNVSFQYSPELPMVLHDISFSLKPSEKIGIIGRTGAGKSSLISVLFRLAEFKGHVYIDGVDIQTIGLHDLRKKMSVIPQDPVLFSGTMRYNLDPFDKYTDTVLWKSLEQVQLSDCISEMEGQLYGEVLEGGSNFSVGQRQLVCLARALIRRNKILILDEATANVDPNTDKIIQGIIREEFSGCTVLTIAHRLNTVMDSDRILVVRDGQIAEFDAPLTLLGKRDSELSRMVEETGGENASKLYVMAAEAHKDIDPYPNTLFVSSV